MAKSKQPLKPIFPLKHEFYETLDKFIHESSMLADALSQAIQLGAVTGPAMSILEERLAAFKAIRSSDE
jgi:hypothetical protein